MKLFLCKRYFIFFPLIFISLFTKGQRNGEFLLLGTVVENGERKLDEVTVTVYEDKTKVLETITKRGGNGLKSGYFEITLKMNSCYLIEFSKPGYVSKTVVASTIPFKGCTIKKWSHDIGKEITLFKNNSETEIYKHPVAYYGFIEKCGYRKLDESSYLDNQCFINNYHQSKLFGKILKQERSSEFIPVKNQKIDLKSDSITVLQTATTDEYGDFHFDKIDNNKKHILELAPNAELKDEKIFLAKQNGIVVGSFLMNKQGTFHYELLPADIVKLEIIAVEPDIKMDVKSFMNSTEKEFIVTDNIYYETAKWAITPSAAERLDKVVFSLTENPDLQVEVYAYTDSRGDAEENMKLSDMRAKSAVVYIISKGISPMRIKGKGFGESKILNRCTDGVTCSEKEHELNRRTEFKFIK